MAHVASMQRTVRRTALIAAALSFGAFAAAGTAQAAPGQPPAPAPTTTTVPRPAPAPGVPGVKPAPRVATPQQATPQQATPQQATPHRATPSEAAATTTTVAPPPPAGRAPAPARTAPPQAPATTPGATPGARVPATPSSRVPATPGARVPATPEAKVPVSPAPSTPKTAPKTPAAPTVTPPPDFKPGPAPTQVAPGDRIDVLQRSLGNGQFDSLQCTMGWTVTAPDGERLGVTAGHCAPPQHPVGVQKYIVGEVVDTQSPPVTPDAKNPGHFTPSDPFAPDWATFRLTDPSVSLRASSPQIKPSGVGVAKVGDRVCQKGSTNGYQCGTVTKVLDNWILTDIVTAPGDSGGPLIRTSDNKALGIITDAVTLSDEQTGQVTDRRTQYYALPSLLAASGGDQLATR